LPLVKGEAFCFLFYFFYKSFCVSVIVDFVLSPINFFKIMIAGKNLFILSVLFLILVQVKLPAQNIDSLYNIANSNSKNIETIRALNKLAWYYFYRNPDSAMILNSEAISLSKELHSNFGLGLSYYFLGSYLTGQMKLDEALDYLSRSYELVKHANDIKIIGDIYTSIGMNYLYRSEFDSCIFYNKKAIEYTRLNNIRGLYSSNNNIAVAYMNQSYYNLATDYLLKALGYVEQLGDANSLYNIYINLASTFLEMGDTEEGLKYLNKMDVNNKDISNKRIFGFMFAIYAYAYTKQEKYEEAIVNQAKDPLGLNDVYVNLSTNFLALNNQDSTWYYIQKGLATIQNQDVPMTKAQLLINLGEYYQKQKQYEKAAECYKNAIEISTKANYLQARKEANQKLAEMYETTGQPDLAIIYYKKFQQNKDSLLNEEKQRQIAQLNIKFETEKKEKENQILSYENKMIQLEVVKRKKQNLIIGITSIILVLVLIIIILSINLKRKKEQHQSKIKQLKAKDEERNLLAKKLHDEIKNDLIGFSVKLKKINEPELSLEIEKTANQLRDLSHRLITHDFKKRSFEDQVKDLLADNINENLFIYHNNLTGINWKAVPDNTKRTLFLVIREAVYNIKKHSQANKATIDFGQKNNKISVTISDNGIGFDQNEVKYGQGLRNIETRVNTLNGKIKIFSQKKKGTKLFIQLMA